MRSKYVQVDGVATNYLHTGAATLPQVRPSLDAGELLLFVHGAGWNAHFWQRQLRHFAAAHSALALDFPGHGRSGSTAGLRTIGAYAEFLAAFVEKLELRRFVLVGSALGGAVAASFAAAHSTRLRGLVLVATPPRFALAPAGVELWREVMCGRAAQPFAADLFAPGADFALMREAWMEQVKTDPRVRYFDLLACVESETGKWLDEISVPTLVVGGAADQIVTPAEVAATHERAAGSRLEMVAEAGHCVGLEQGDAFNQVVETFLETLSA